MARHGRNMCVGATLRSCLSSTTHCAWVGLCCRITGTVLCCAVQCCAVLCCVVLCCVVLCCTVLCCAVLCCVVLCCAVLCCAVFRVVRVAAVCSCDNVYIVVQVGGGGGEVLRQ